MEQECWGRIRSELLSSLGKDAFTNWIDPLELLEAGGRVAQFSVPTSFIGNWVSRNYGESILGMLQAEGLKRWVFPLELSAATLADMQAERPQGVETELLVYGRLPLAYSARCFTARAHNLPKDDCQYRCLDYPDGITLSAQDETRFLALNGIQTQSAQTLNLLSELNNIRDLRVDVIRISPQSRKTERVIDIFQRCLQGELDLEEGSAELERMMPVGPCDGYWYGEAGMDRISAAARKMTGT